MILFPGAAPCDLPVEVFFLQCRCLPCSPQHFPPCTDPCWSVLWPITHQVCCQLPGCLCTLPVRSAIGPAWEMHELQISASCSGTGGVVPTPRLSQISVTSHRKGSYYPPSQTQQVYIRKWSLQNSPIRRKLLDERAAGGKGK